MLFNSRILRQGVFVSGVTIKRIILNKQNREGIGSMRKNSGTERKRTARQEERKLASNQSRKEAMEVAGV